MKRLLMVLLVFSAFCLTAHAQDNLALGGGVTVVASSSYSANFPASAVIDGDRTGYGWGAGGGWNDATREVFPDTITTTLQRTYSIGRVVLYTTQNDPSNPGEPSDTLTCQSYGAKDFTVEILNSAGLVVASQSVTGNTLCKRTVIFSPAVRGQSVRVSVTASWDGLFSRWVEKEIFNR
jgi:hypothetical protein